MDVSIPDGVQTEGRVAQLCVPVHRKDVRIRFTRPPFVDKSQDESESGMWLAVGGLAHAILVVVEMLTTCGRLTYVNAYETATRRVKARESRLESHEDC